MSDENRHLPVFGPTKRFPEAFFLLVLFVSFLFGALFSYFTPYGSFSPHLKLGILRPYAFSVKLELLFRISVFLFPCVLLLFFSSSTCGCVVLPALFFFFGCFTVNLCREISFGTYGEYFIGLKKILPAFFLLPALFLLGEISFQKSYQLYRFSSSGLPVSVIKIPGERVIAAFGLVLLAAILRQYI